MATKKVGKAAILAARKDTVPVGKWRRPRMGDVVWVEGKGILGGFHCYDQKYDSLVLTWPSGYPVLLPYAWPGHRAEFHPIDFSTVKVLTPSEILAKVDYLLRHRDDRLHEKIVEAVENNIRGALFVGSS